MPSLMITRSQARKFLLAYQSLWPPRSLQGKAGIMDFIRRVRCVQFDPLDIAGQNADLVLQSRVVDYTPAQLRELLYQDRQLLDGWDKNMAIYPIEDWPFFSRRRQAAKNGLRSTDAVRAIAPLVITAIEERGPLSSLDLDFDQEVNWYWAPTRLARAALESLYFSGELVIHRKIHTRKVYDLAHRHIPQCILDMAEPNLSESEYQDWYILRRIGSTGLLWNRGGEIWLGVPAKTVQRTIALRRLINRGEVQEIMVEGIEVPFYIRAQDRPFFDEVLQQDQTSAQIAFIAPLDNFMWDRRMLKELFGFDYRWEVYKPQDQREYGYYVLPVLYGDRFVARFEPVREKKSGTMVIKNWWWEPGIKPTDPMVAALEESFKYFIQYLNIKQIMLGGELKDPVETRWLVTQLIKEPYASMG
jgi:uncharacterized protein